MDCVQEIHNQASEEQQWLLACFPINDLNTLQKQIYPNMQLRYSKNGLVKEEERKTMPTKRDFESFPQFVCIRGIQRSLAILWFNFCGLADLFFYV